MLPLVSLLGNTEQNVKTVDIIDIYSIESVCHRSLLTFCLACSEYGDLRLAYKLVVLKKKKRTKSRLRNRIDEQNYVFVLDSKQAAALE